MFAGINGVNVAVIRVVRLNMIDISESVVTTLTRKCCANKYTMVTRISNTTLPFYTARVSASFYRIITTTTEIRESGTREFARSDDP